MRVSARRRAHSSTACCSGRHLRVAVPLQTALVWLSPRRLTAVMAVAAVGLVELLWCVPVSSPCCECVL